MSKIYAFGHNVGIGLMSALPLVLGAGCGVPFSQSLYTPEVAATDEGLPGTWVWEDDRDRIEIRVETPDAEAKPGVFESRFLIDRDDERVAEFDVDLRLVTLGGQTFADLSLGDDERERSFETIGMLALPVHQIYRVDRDGDGLSVRTLDYDRLQSHLDAGLIPLTHTTVSMDGNDLILITSATADLQAFFEGVEDEVYAGGIDFVRTPGG